MNEILERIRKPSIFILLLVLNLRFLFTVVFNDREEIFSILTILFFFLSFDYTGIRREHLYWLLFFVVLSVLDFTPNKLNILTPLILMQCISRFDIRTYLQYNLIILGGTAILMLVLYGVGHMSFGTGVDLVRFRYDFGFGHPNAAALYYWGIFVTLALSCYLSKYKRLIWIFLAILLLGCIYLYTETVSRSFIASVFLFITVFAYYTLRRKFKKNYVIGYSRYILFILPLLLTLLTIYFSLNADKYVVLDVLFSNRLSLYRTFLHGLTSIEYLQGTVYFDQIVVDNSYLHLLFESGIFLFVYFIWLYYFAIRNIIKQQNFLVIAIFVSFLVYGLMESLLLFCVIIGNNLFWVLLYRYRYEADEEFDLEERDADD